MGCGVSDIWIQAPASSLVSYIISWDLSKFPEIQFLLSGIIASISQWEG